MNEKNVYMAVHLKAKICKFGNVQKIRCLPHHYSFYTLGL